MTDGARDQPFPEDEQQFQALMEEVDAELRQDNAHIPTRPLKAHVKLIQRFLISRVLSRPDGEPEDGSYEGLDLVRRAYDWYDDRYASRLETGMSPGRLALLVRDDPWTMELPLMFGECRLVADPEEESDPEGLRRAGSGPPPKYNVLDSLTDMPEGVKNSLTPEECAEILRAFLLGHKTFKALKPHRESQLVREAQHDAEATVYHLTTHPRNCGRARWMSLQAAEKILKGYLDEAGAGFPHTHNLSTLADEAEDQGLEPIPADVLDAVQCEAGVRYGDIDVNLPDAVQAHHLSLGICLHVGEKIPS